MFDRHFTLNEARSELPRLRDDLLRLQQELARLQNQHEAAAPAREHSDGNGGGAAVSGYLQSRTTVGSIIEAIQERGIQIKDPARGLVDFPHIRNGREVFLCFLLGEEDIRYWHDIEAGFGGRQPL
jgi:hypothetical protein